MRRLLVAALLVAAAPGHVEEVRRLVLDALTPEQVGQLRTIAHALLARLDPDGAMTAPYARPAATPGGATGG